MTTTHQSSDSWKFRRRDVCVVRAVNSFFVGTSAQMLLTSLFKTIEVVDRRIQNVRFIVLIQRWTDSHFAVEMP